MAREVSPILWPLDLVAGGDLQRHPATLDGIGVVDGEALVLDGGGLILCRPFSAASYARTITSMVAESSMRWFLGGHFSSSAPLGRCRRLAATEGR